MLNFFMSLFFRVDLILTLRIETDASDTTHASGSMTEGFLSFCYSVTQGLWLRSLQTYFPRYTLTRSGNEPSVGHSI